MLEPESTTLSNNESTHNLNGNFDGFYRRDFMDYAQSFGLRSGNHRESLRTIPARFRKIRIVVHSLYPTYFPSPYNTRCTNDTDRLAVYDLWMELDVVFRSLPHSIRNFNSNCFLVRREVTNFWVFIILTFFYRDVHD